MNDTDPEPSDEVRYLRSRVAELERQIADKDRHIVELREAISALMQPAPSELLAKNMAHPSRQ